MAGEMVVSARHVVSIYPLLRTSTPLRHGFALSTAEKRCVALRRRWVTLDIMGGRADLFTKHLTGAMAGEMVVGARHVLFFSFSRFRH